VLEGRYLDRADPGKGRFRSFLLTSWRFFVADEEDRAHTNAAAVWLCRWNSRQAKSPTNASLRTMGRPSASSNGAGQEIADTVAAEVESELRFLGAVLTGN